MGKRPLINSPGPTLGFHMPDIRGKQFAPGRQPYNPGNSYIAGAQIPLFKPIPWPNAVPVLKTLASNPGIPRTQALGVVNNSEAVLLSNYLFLGGFAGKSRG